MLLASVSFASIAIDSGVSARVVLHGVRYLAAMRAKITALQPVPE